MAQKRLVSRILKNFSPELLMKMKKICNDNIISDNNQKADMILNLLKQYKNEDDFIELGPGTNRLAILIDGYVFKIALDKWGIQDNWNEFTLSEELQPYVIKVYETNGLLLVCEYITVISQEEFEENKEQLKEILEDVSESYLLGDVGTVTKNFLNWGYRDNGEFVILDFAYIYRVTCEQLLCSDCQILVEYDENYYNMYCPACGKKYTFSDLKRRISLEEENKQIFYAKKFAHKITQPEQMVDDNIEEDEKIIYNNEEENKMRKEELRNVFVDGVEDNTDAEQEFLSALDEMRLWHEKKNKNAPVQQQQQPYQNNKHFNNGYRNNNYNQKPRHQQPNTHRPEHVSRQNTQPVQCKPVVEEKIVQKVEELPQNITSIETKIDVENKIVEVDVKGDNEIPNELQKEFIKEIQEEVVENVLDNLSEIANEIEAEENEANALDALDEFAQTEEVSKFLSNNPEPEIIQGIIFPEVEKKTSSIKTISATADIDLMREELKKGNEEVVRTEGSIHVEINK